MNKFMSELFDAYIESYTRDCERFAQFREAVADVYDTPEIQGLVRFPQHGKINRLDHITSVAYISWLAAKRLGIDPVATARAAVLHDLVYYDWHENDWSHRPHGYRHPGFAVKNARALTTISKREQNAIYRHMWPLTPVPPRYSEGWVLTMADKYCANLEMKYKNSAKYRERFASLTGIEGMNL
jgi:uncharacterized protein